MDLLLALRGQWYNEPQFIVPFECLSCLVARPTTIFIPVSTGNQTWVAFIGTSDLAVPLDIPLAPVVLLYVCMSMKSRFFNLSDFKI